MAAFNGNHGWPVPLAEAFGQLLPGETVPRLQPTAPESPCFNRCGRSPTDGHRTEERKGTLHARNASSMNYPWRQLNGLVDRLDHCAARAGDQGVAGERHATALAVRPARPAIAAIAAFGEWAAAPFHVA